MSSKETIISLSKPSIWIEEWNSLKTKKCIMVCHDQDIDRRIMQQARSLIKQKVNVLIICLSHNQCDETQRIGDLFIHRIGLSRIVPDCQVYWLYQSISNAIGNSVFFNTKFKAGAHKLNWSGYKALLKLVYLCPTVNFPLPFDFCFRHALEQYEGSFIIAHDLPALKASVERAVELSVPLIYDSHELYSEQKVFSRKQKSILEKREAQYIEQCSHVISVNPSFISIMSKKNTLVATDVILNAHPIHMAKKTTSLHEMINKPLYENIILFQGGMMKNRNLLNLVKGFLLLKNKNVNLVFLGPRDKGLEKELIRLKEKSNNQNIFFLDSVAQDVLLDITSTATFGVVPYIPCDINTRFCMPNKFFEYIQAELPILYHHELEEVDTIIKKTGGGMGDDLSSPKKVRRALEHMLLRDFKKDRQALIAVKNKICWETEEVKFLDIIRKVCK